MTTSTRGGNEALTRPDGTPIRILTVDDESSLTELLSMAMRYEGWEVSTAGSGLDAVKVAREVRPDAIVLDMMLPDFNGLEVMRRIRTEQPDVPVIFLTARDAPADQVAGLETGADDYVVKPFTFEVLLARVRALLRRRQGERPPVLRFADLTLDTGTHAVRRGEREVALTSLEFKLLHEFLAHPQQVLAKEALLDRVWGYDFGGNANVVEVYVKQLRQKLGAAGEPPLIHTIRGAGYVLREE